MGDITSLDQHAATRGVQINGRNGGIVIPVIQIHSWRRDDDVSGEEHPDESANVRAMADDEDVYRSFRSLGHCTQKTRSVTNLN